MAKKKLKNKGKQVNKTTVNNICNKVIDAAYSVPTPPVIPPVFMKVCRLCESKDGPFLNIFDADKVTAKKIDELMPFNVTENDDLPHKICFRCSAKLEELYEFIQKCIKTQENLRSAMGNNAPIITKSKKGKTLWEEKLNKSNMTNDDICNALIQKAMEGIKSISPHAFIEEPSEPKRVTRSKEQAAKQEIKNEPKPDDADEMSLRQVKFALDDKTPSNKALRSNKVDTVQTKKGEETQVKKPAVTKKSEVQAKQTNTNEVKKQEASETSDSRNKNKPVGKTKNISVNNFSSDYQAPSVAVKDSDSEEEKKEEPKKPFNIMDYISMIKVNGVGVLFQCKLCNRNFLKKEVVESHSCAKNGIPKQDIPKSVPVPEPPKVSTVKYIKIDSDMKKSLTEKIKRAEQAEQWENEKNIAVENITQENSEPPKPKPKPKAGPASKTRRNLLDTDSSTSQSAESVNTGPPVTPATPTVHFPSLPNLNSRFKLVPGPNNIFTLVEDTSQVLNIQAPTENSKAAKKRKSDAAVTAPTVPDKSDSPEVIDINEKPKPYPVGLFQTVAHSDRHYNPPVSAVPATFTTPAMKKQSYTIVQTGNPSKLLISTKAKAVELEEPSRKRQRKIKPEVREDIDSKEPYTVTLEDVAPPKDTGFFTFINVDPLLQPSYVLPTDNIIQESQISTSSAVVRAPTESKESQDKYTCNMCGENFSREKKLLTHIHSHYTKMDEEDELRADKGTKKRTRK